jgi:hypothetical protein
MLITCLFSITKHWLYTLGSFIMFFLELNFTARYWLHIINMPIHTYVLSIVSNIKQISAQLKIKLLILAIVCVYLSNNASNQPTQPLPLNAQIAIGLGMGAADALTSTPFYFEKNRRQLIQKALLDNQPVPKIPKNPLLWFKGTGANCVGLIAVAQAQNITFEALNQNGLSRWVSAPLSGALAAVVANPADLVLRQIQNQPAHAPKMPISTVMRILYKQQGMRCFMRGFGNTCIREAGFTTGYLAAIPACREFLEKSNITGTAKTGALLGCACAIGLATTIATHPFDTIAGELQNEPGNYAYTTKQVIQKIYTQKKFGGFLTGVMPRAQLIILSLLVLDKTKTDITNFIKKLLA